MRYCTINIWDGSELEIAWSKKSSSYFEMNFPIFLLYVILNTTIFKVRDILHWVDLLAIKTFSNIFHSSLCCSRFWIVFSFLVKLHSHHPYTFTSPMQQTQKQNQRASHNCYSVKKMLKFLAFKMLLKDLELELNSLKLFENSFF